MLSVSLNTSQVTMNFKPLMVKTGRYLCILATCSVFFLILPFAVFQYPDNSDISDFRTKAAFSDSSYFFAANFFNNEDIIAHWTEEFLKVASVLGKHRVFLSVYENDSGDDTSGLLKEFDSDLSKAGIPHRIVTHKNQLRQHYPDRIDYLAVIRNKALDPLLNFINNGVMFADINYTASLVGSRNSRVVFINDIYFKAIDIVRLIGTQNFNYDIACGMDFYNQFYDHYVTRDIHGDWFTNVYPFVKDPASQKLLREKKPFPVYSCWNGAASMRVEPFYRHNVKFRSVSGLEQCDHSECFLICEDFREFNFTDIYINPRVKVTYKKRDYVFQQYVMPVAEIALSLLNLPSPDYIAPEFSEHPNKRLTVQCGIPSYA